MVERIQKYFAYNILQNLIYTFQAQVTAIKLHILTIFLTDFYNQSHNNKQLSA